MTDSEVIQLFKSMIDRDPLVVLDTCGCGHWECLWCGAYSPSGTWDHVTKVATYPATEHAPDCQWIRAMDILGLPHPDHVVKEG